MVSGWPSREGLCPSDYIETWKLLRISAQFFSEGIRSHSGFQLKFFPEVAGTFKPAHLCNLQNLFIWKTNQKLSGTADADGQKVMHDRLLHDFPHVSGNILPVEFIEFFDITDKNL